MYDKPDLTFVGLTWALGRWASIGIAARSPMRRPCLIGDSAEPRTASAPLSWT